MGKGAPEAVGKPLPTAGGGAKRRERKKSVGGGAGAARGRAGVDASPGDAGDSGKTGEVLSPSAGGSGQATSTMGEVLVPGKKPTVSWDDKVKMLESFNQLHGHVCVPKHDAELGWWVQQCRQMHNSGKMPEEKRERLESLGFVWCGQEAKRIREQAEGKTVSSWDDRFRTLMEFREVHGHTCVPMQRHDPGLGAWVKEQRSLNNAGKLQEERKQKLISIGFIFDGAEAKRIREQAEGKPASSWEDKYALLEKFKEQHGHTCVPLQRHDPGLGCWVREQRSLYNSGKLQEARREKLQALGFIFDGSEAKKVREQSEGKACHSWNDKFKLLEAFKEKHGHTCVPKQEAELGWWVQQCRQLYNSGKLAEDKRERLEVIGFVFDGAEAKRVRDSFHGKPIGTWEDKLELLKAFKEQNGHTLVAQRHPSLGFWVKEQRMAHSRGRLTEERRLKLDELGFSWQAGPGEDGAESPSQSGLGAAGGPLGAGPRPRAIAATGAKKVAQMRADGSSVLEGSAAHAQTDEERKASLDFLCNPEKAWGGHASGASGQLAPAHQRPEEGVVAAVATVTLVNCPDEELVEGLSGVGSKRPHPDGARDGGDGKKADGDGQGGGGADSGEPPSKRPAIEIQQGGVGEEKASSDKVDSAAIVAARELFKSSRERCKQLLEAMQTCRGDLLRRCQVSVTYVMYVMSSFRLVLCSGIESDGESTRACLFSSRR